ncbi:MAG: carboxypeptidase regulatory-like domain-containing protein, partial [Spirochaetales bacterium]|nr:carboxypeptidase regulatory-like domain-containing protein [Spirochaetales bacterium]
DRDEYLVKVTAPDYTAALGKQFFSLSPLTEASKQGTGASVSTDFGNLSFSAFALDNLLEMQNESRFGGKASYRFGDRGVAAFNLLEAADNGRWTSGSLEGHFLLPSGNRFEWEYASSNTSLLADDAWYANLGGSSDPLSYNLRYLRAGPGYRGSLEDVEQLIASVNYVPPGPIRLRALLGRKDNNLARELPDSLRSTQFGFSWAGFDHTLFSADIVKTLNEDRGSDPVERLERETYRFALVRDTPSAEFKLSYEFGNALNADSLPRSFSERINARLDVASVVLGNLGASLVYCFRDYQDTKAPYSDVTLAWERELNGRLGLSARYRTVNSNRSYYLGSDNLSVTLDVAFPNQAEMALTAEYGPHRSTGNPEDLKVTITFSTPFPIPVSVKRNIGRIEGKILDAVSGKPAQDIVLRLGDAVAATDPFGRYSFHSLPPGLHRLYVDPASLPADYIAMEKMPLEVTVSDTTTEKDIRITRAAGITGRIVLFRFDRNYRWLGGDQGAAYIDPTGMPGVLLTAAGPAGIRRALSGDDGNFSFPPLVPGEWKLTVPEGALPEGHFLAKGEFDLVLEPGQQEDIIIKIFPKVRQIRFIDQGTILEEASPQGPQESAVEEEPQGAEAE